MNNNKILELPAAERIKMLAIRIHGPESTQLFKPGIVARKYQQIECTCGCHPPRPSVLSIGTDREICRASCTGCNIFWDHQLTAAMDAARPRLLQCCADQKWQQIEAHQTSSEHLCNEHEVVSSDVNRLGAIIRTTPIIWQHPEVIVPMMKAFYGYAVTIKEPLIEMRQSFIARVILQDLVPGLPPFVKKIYAYRVAQKEKKMGGGYISSHSTLTPMGISGNKKAVNAFYRRDGVSEAESFWGEKDGDL